MNATTIDKFIDVSAWLTHIGTYYNVHIQSGWEFVDALRLGIEQFGGQNRAAVSELYDLASQHVGLAVRTLQNYVSISRSFPPGRRQPELGINHYIALQGLPEGQQDEMADMAVANGLSVEALRHEVRKTRPGYITDDSNQPGRTLSPPSAYATRNGYHATDDIDDRAEYLAAAPDAYDDVPFSHHSDDEHPAADLWPDERIDAMVDKFADATDDYIRVDGELCRVQVVNADNVRKLLRTMRDEYEALAK
jgi:hypothetical protein